ncbi:MAG: hypothetical protein QOE66_3427 [Chloroflexota bacterium]|nr:hypothetical protein [Chloroflexota bacterium]
MRRPFFSRSIAILLTAGALLLGSFALAGGATAATKIASTTTCSNGVDNTGGLGLICQVTVVNTIRSTGGTARVTVVECHGAAGHPRASCTTRISNLTGLVTKVTQCNDSISGGGGTLRCSVRVTNQFVGVSPTTTAASVNQCVGSATGGGIKITCDPFPATTTGATITQCDGSANGGGLVKGSTCTATGTKASALSVRINQCNGSANGGGALIICSASITNVRVAAASITSGGTTSGSSPTGPPTSVSVRPVAPAGGSDPIIPIGLAILAILGAIVAIARYPARRSAR